MKNLFLISLFLLLVAAVGVGVYVYIRPNNSSPTQSTVTDEPMIQSDGHYTPFTPEVLATSATTRRVLYFYANWCPTCKPANESFINRSDQIPSDVTLIRVNYNDSDTDQAEKDLAKKYTITYQHTFVQIDAEGNELTKWNGGEIEELLQNLK